MKDEFHHLMTHFKNISLIIYKIYNFDMVILYYLYYVLLYLFQYLSF